MRHVCNEAKHTYLLSGLQRPVDSRPKVQLVADLLATDMTVQTLARAVLTSIGLQLYGSRFNSVIIAHNLCACG